MNSAALHSAKLIAEFEKQQLGEQEPIPQYPSEHPFGASKPGPFGGASASGGQTNNIAPFASLTHHPQSQPNTFTADNEMSNFAGWDTSYSRPAAAAANSTDLRIYNAQPGRSTTTAYQPRPLTQYDYPAGWAAQTFSAVGGLTEDSASRIATLQAKLNQRLGPEYLSQRPGPGGGKKLTYIEGWKLVDLANEVFGFNGWSTTIVRLDVDFLDCSPDGSRFNAGVSCVIRVTLRDGAFHEDIGYGSAENARQKHAALEKGKKEAVTDATKRALKNFGKLLGNCTYDHQYSANALKVSNPAPKFDASELHRRPELRAQMAPPPQPPASAPQAAPPQQAQAQAAAPATWMSSANEVAATATNPPVPTRTDGAPLGVKPNHVQISIREKDNSPAQPAAEDHLNVSERQQRSMLARQAYLERQQAEARSSKATTANGSESVATTASSHSVVTSANGAQRHQGSAADLGFNSDSFDDGLNDVLATYDETEMGDAEAASHAIEMEIDQAQPQRPSAEEEKVPHPNYNAADDSGVAFPASERGTPAVNMVQIKQEKINQAAAKPLEIRRSTSPVKQVKSEAAKQPRRAGSVGRFVSPPPPPPPPRIPAPPIGALNGAGMMRNGSTSLSAASNGCSSNGWSAANGQGSGITRRMGSTLGGTGGVEGMAVNREAAMAGKRVGESVQHAFLAANETALPRGLKRANQGEVGRAAPARPAAAGTSVVFVQQS
ncbi:hypothetical protein NDA13_000079 [Ustilago tritici]|nr:hypothetical protein NDA13_000079 [Ustilago tritici]WJN25041.1 DNA repair and recombination protein [Ustilago tritici]